MSGLRVVTVTVGLCAALGAAATARADILWDQGPGLGDIAYFASTNHVAHSQKAADNFVLTAPSSVTEVEWWGRGWDANVDRIPGDDALANVSGFLIEFFDTSGSTGGVGSLLHSEVVAPGDLSVTFGASTIDDPMDIVATLASPVTLAAGTQYWVAVNAIQINTSGSVMGWEVQGGTNPNADDLLDADSPVDGVWDGPFAASDTAFRLHGSVIPEPDAGLLGLSGLLLVGLLRRNVTG